MSTYIKKEQIKTSEIIINLIKKHKIMCYSEIKKELESPLHSIFLTKPAIYYHLNKLIEHKKIKIADIKRDKKIKNNIPISYFCIQTGNIAKIKTTK